MTISTSAFKTPQWVLNYKYDSRNLIAPYKVITYNGPALRFATRDDAITFFHKTQGRCLVSYNTKKKQVFIAYKFK